MSPYGQTFRSLMHSGRAGVARFCADEAGNTAVEYGIILGLISVAIVATLTAIGETIRDDVFGAIVEAFNAG